MGATQRINNNLNTVANHHPLQPIPTWVIVSAPISTAARALCVNYAAAQPPLPPASWPRGPWPPESKSSLTPLCLLPTSVTTEHQHHADHQSRKSLRVNIFDLLAGLISEFPVFSVDAGQWSHNILRISPVPWQHHHHQISQQLRNEWANHPEIQKIFYNRRLEAHLLSVKIKFWCHYLLSNTCIEKEYLDSNEKDVEVIVPKEEGSKQESEIRSWAWTSRGAKQKIFIDCCKRPFTIWKRWC